MNWTEVWRFETARHAIVLSVAPEDMDPADSFEFPEDIEAIRSGVVDWFTARVTVEKDGIELGSDYLGGCAYKTVREFYTSHRDSDPLNRNSSLMREARGENVVMCQYFPSMVREAIGQARGTLKKLCA